MKPSRLALILTLSTGPALAATSTSSEAWIFTKHFAVLPPRGWKVLSQSDEPSVGYEMLLGAGPKHYARFFVSGDKLTRSEFQKRMKDVIASKGHYGSKDSDLLAEPSIETFGNFGLRLQLTFKSRIQNGDYVEIHSPLVVANQGLDLLAVAPLNDKELLNQEMKDLLANLRLNWDPQATHSKAVSATSHKVVPAPTPPQH